MKGGFSPSAYINMSYDDLLVYSLFELQSSNEHTTFENLVAKCYGLFPKRFQLPGYPNWPDASLVERSWLRCRTDKGLIYGSKSKGFTLTSKGVDLAKLISQELQGVKLKDSNLQPKGDSRTRSGRLVKHIERSLAFKKYKQDNKVDRISEFEFCDLVYSTLDTDPSLRKRNLEELKYHCNVYERKDMLTFFEQCEKRFKNLLRDASEKYYEGGMMRKKKRRKNK